MVMCEATWVIGLSKAAKVMTGSKVLRGHKSEGRSCKEVHGIVVTRGSIVSDGEVVEIESLVRSDVCTVCRLNNGRSSSKRRGKAGKRKTENREEMH